MNTREMFNEYLEELDQVVMGTRGYVGGLSRKAAEMGLQIGSLTMAAKAKGLEIVRHGRYGFCAVRPINR